MIEQFQHHSIVFSDTDEVFCYLLNVDVFSIHVGVPYVGVEGKPLVLKLVPYVR